jgi:hypothetical protein
MPIIYSGWVYLVALVCTIIFYRIARDYYQ